MPKIKKASKRVVKGSTPAPMYPSFKQSAKMLAETSDEELGKAYRQRHETNHFLQVRGLY